MTPTIVEIDSYIPQGKEKYSNVESEFKVCADIKDLSITEFQIEGIRKGIPFTGHTYERMDLQRGSFPSNEAIRGK